MFRLHPIRRAAAFAAASAFISLLLLSACTAGRELAPTEAAFSLPAASSTAPSTPTQPPETATPEPSPVPATLTPTEITPTLEPTTAVAPPESTTPPASPPPEESPAPSRDAILVDHNSITLFDQIPPEYLQKAAGLRVVFYDASVGKNISEGLDCLAAPNWVQSPVWCRRDYTGQGQEWKVFVEADYSAGRVPERILFPGGPEYDRSRWVFSPLGGTWQDATRDFITKLVPEALDQYDVFSYKINYLMVVENSSIMDPVLGFFADRPDQTDVHDLKALAEAHPDKTFFLFTTSLARSIGTQNSEDFNNELRRYAAANGMPLLDLAAILSHTPSGEPCYDNRDGVRACANNGECEDFPDDGLNLAAICQDYTTEIEGGHLGSVSGGMIRSAKAFWVLMAQIAGWKPGV